MIGKRQGNMIFTGQINRSPSYEHGMMHMNNIISIFLKFLFNSAVKGIWQDNSPNKAIQASRITKNIILLLLFSVSRRKNRHLVSQSLQSFRKTLYGNRNTSHHWLIIIRHQRNSHLLHHSLSEPHYVSYDNPNS